MQYLHRDFLNKSTKEAAWSTRTKTTNRAAAAPPEARRPANRNPDFSFVFFFFFSLSSFLNQVDGHFQGFLPRPVYKGHLLLGGTGYASYTAQISQQPGTGAIAAKEFEPTLTSLITYSLV